MLNTRKRLFLNRAQRSGPVSYTHLDVYKRQVYENGAFAPSVSFDDVRSRAAVAIEIMEPEWRAL